MAKARNELPSAAFKVNGVFVEDTVSGYHSLNAEGKWTLPKEVSTVDTAIRSGSIFVNSRYPQREIEIEYLIEGTGWEDLQDKYNKLMRVLDNENAEIIFNGEPDKFIRGYFSIDSNIDTTMWTRSGTFTIVCPDPFKYSVTEYEETAAGGQFSVTYNGSYKSYPVLTAQFPSSKNASGDETSTNECGYVGFTNQRGAILQFGDPNETDWGDVTYPATTPLNKAFKSTSGWTTNGSSVLKGTQVGSIGITDNHAYPSAWGTNSSGYHGPSLSYIITGESSPIGKNFNFTLEHKFGAAKTEYGGFECLLWNNNSGTRTLMAGFVLLKTAKSVKCNIQFFVGGTSAKATVKNIPVANFTTSSIKKMGNKVTFTVGKQTKSYASDNIEDLIANEVTFHFIQNKSQSAIATANFYVKSCKLQRLSFDDYGDIANIFSPGDVLTVDTADAGVYLDDGSASIPATYLGALGNDWEEFALVPGSNTIAADYSDFTTTSPTFKIKYRERFL